MGLKISMRHYGGEIRTTVCELNDDHGRTWSGYGKGIGLQSDVSALFESIEHMSHALSLQSDKITTRPFNRNAADAVLLDGSPPFHRFAIDGINLSRLQFHNQQGTMYVPAFLMHTRFSSKLPKEAAFIARTSINRYSTNSGTASGIKKADAVLHGIFEVIERDALSILLLKTCFTENPDPLRKIIKESLPSEVTDILHCVCSESSSTIDLFDMTSDLGVPAVLARLTKKTGESYFGYGASIWLDNAIIRSTLEALQGFHIFNFEKRRLSVSPIACTPSLSPYSRCLLEYGIFKPRGGEVLLTYAELLEKYPITEQPLALSDAIQISKDLLRVNGIDIYERLICESNDYVVCQVYSPQLERFYLATSGVMVAPGYRGASALDW